MQISKLPKQGNAMSFDHIFNNNKTNNKYQYDVNTIQPKLVDNIQEFAVSLLGTPNKELSNSMQLRFNSKGSMAVTIQGSKQGLWYDHEVGKGGNLLHLIQYVRQCNFKESLEYAAKYLGISQQTDANSYVDKVHSFSKPIKNTLAERYLREHRGITADLNENLRFVPYLYEKTTGQKHPALVVFSKDTMGNVKGMQAIWLDHATGKKLDIDIAKRSYGQIKGTMVPVNKGSFAVAVCEGIETALSVASANPNLTVFAALGSFVNFSSSSLKSNGSPLILCADNDSNNQNTFKKLNRAVSELSEKGFNVFVTKPDRVGMDFNDVLRQEGKAKITEYLDKASIKQVAKSNSNFVQTNSVRTNVKETELER